jgi:hypothetical protein
MTTRLTIPFLLFALLLLPLPTRQGAAFAQSARAVKTYALPVGESPVALLESGRRTWLVNPKKCPGTPTERVSCAKWKSPAPLPAP